MEYYSTGSIINYYWILCKKYRKVLSDCDIQSIDTLLYVVWKQCSGLVPYDQGTETVNLTKEELPELTESQRKTHIEYLIEELKHIYNRLEEFGISYDEIRQKLWNIEPISRISFHKGHSLYLIDYDIKIKFSPIQYSVYILFLRHPEGIYLKHIANYSDELREIYRNALLNKSRKCINETRISSIVERISDPTNHTLLEYISQIRRLFLTAIEYESRASHYYIKGARNKKYGISISRHFVVNN